MMRLHQMFMFKELREPYSLLQFCPVQGCEVS